VKLSLTSLLAAHGRLSFKLSVPDAAFLHSHRIFSLSERSLFPYLSFNGFPFTSTFFSSSCLPAHGVRSFSFTKDVYLRCRCLPFVVCLKYVASLCDNYVKTLKKQVSIRTVNEIS
jgi:hypothetical protein